LQVPAATGDPAWVAAPAALAGVLGSGYGAALIARLAVLFVVAALLPRVLRGRTGRVRGPALTAGRVRGPALVALAVGGLTTWPLTGHAVASPMPPVAAAADVVHLAAMAVWLGGLVTLAVFLLRRTPPRVLGVLLPAWSRWAAIAVVWLVAGGVVQAVVHVGSVGALWQTGYGRLLLAKIGILAATLAAAGYARRLVHRRAVPVAGPGRLRVAIGIEMAATAVILGLSGALVQANPIRAAADRPAAVDDGVSQTLTCPLYTLQFNIYPVQVGENNTIHAFAYTPAGAPLNVDQWAVSARLAGPGGLEPVSAPLLGLIPRNHAAGAVTFPQAGTYQVRFTLRIGELDQATVTTSITVPQIPEAR
jgi:copper transport protein